jgi:hypothetical protein
LTNNQLKESEALNEIARNYKTPLKTSQKSQEEEIEEMLSILPTHDLYKRKIVSHTDMEEIKDVDSKFLVNVIQGMEEKLEELTQKTVILDAVTEQVSKKVKLELPILFSKTTSLDTTIGKQVMDERVDFLAPTVWSSIALLTTMIRDTQTQMPDFGKVA